MVSISNMKATSASLSRSVLSIFPTSLILRLSVELLLSNANEPTVCSVQLLQIRPNQKTPRYCYRPINRLRCPRPDTDTLVLTQCDIGNAIWRVLIYEICSSVSPFSILQEQLELRISRGQPFRQSHRSLTPAKGWRFLRCTKLSHRPVPF